MADGGVERGSRHVLDLVQQGARPSDAAEAMRRADVSAVEVAPRTWMVQPSLVNVYVLETDDGLVMIDCGLRSDADTVYDAVRSRLTAPLHTVVFTHGHLDHAFGLGRFLDDGASPASTRW
jgi:glyoxylase-like metal-dependent hydrolase (beta-lactamase superfamily II)